MTCIIKTKEAQRKVKHQASYQMCQQKEQTIRQLEHQSTCSTSSGQTNTTKKKWSDKQKSFAINSSKRLNEWKDSNNFSSLNTVLAAES